MLGHRVNVGRCGLEHYTPPVQLRLVWVFIRCHLDMQRVGTCQYSWIFRIVRLNLSFPRSRWSIDLRGNAGVLEVTPGPISFRGL